MKKLVSNKDMFQDIKLLIAQARNNVSIAINSELSLLYWKIGRKINEEILKFKRAEYGEKIIADLSKQLTLEYGRGWSEKQLRHCLRTAETFPDEKIFSALRRELNWTHIKALMYIDNPLKREFYTMIAVNERWSSRQLQERMNSQLFERTAISKKPELTIRNDLKIKLKDEGFELYDKIVQLKLPASDGKYYETDCANTETLLRIVQSVPSKKAEPFNSLRS